MSEMYWFNYKTGEYEYITCPQDFAPYIPQSPAAQNLYKLYVENMNFPPIEAACKVLEAACGKAVEHGVHPTNDGLTHVDSESTPAVISG